MFTSPEPHGELKLPWYVLERPSRTGNAVNFWGQHCSELLDTGDCEDDEWGETAEPHAYSVGPCELWQKPWWHWVHEGKSQDYERSPKSRITAPYFRRTDFKSSGTWALFCPVWKSPKPVILWASFPLWMSFPLFHCPVFCLLMVQLLDHPVSVQLLNSFHWTVGADWSALVSHVLTDFCFTDLFWLPVLWCLILSSTAVLQVKVVIRLLRRGKDERNKGTAGAIFSLFSLSSVYREWQHTSR